MKRLIHNGQVDLFSHCQRWRNGRASYRPAGELFDPRYAEVVEIDEGSAKAYITSNHYSGSYPAARFRVGVMIKRPFQPERLAGCAVFSVPATQAAIPAWFPELSPAAGIELGRFALDQDLEANAETYVQARAIKLMRAKLPEVRAVLSYCDPVGRTAADGTVTFPGHLGTIYRAGNASLLGRSTPRTLKLMPNGRVANGRMLSKIRSEEQGVGYALRLLQDAGAPGRLPFETGGTYLERLAHEGFFRNLRHGGNLVFGWRLKPTRSSPDRAGTR